MKIVSKAHLKIMLTYVIFIPLGMLLLIFLHRFLNFNPWIINFYLPYIAIIMGRSIWIRLKIAAHRYEIFTEEERKSMTVKVFFGAIPAEVMMMLVLLHAFFSEL